MGVFMIKKTKIIISSFLISLVLMVSGANAVTVDAVDLLPAIFGDPIDWKDINGKYRFETGRRHYDIKYDSDDFLSIIPEDTLANLRVIIKVKKNGAFRRIGRYKLTDNLGDIIDKAFWVALACHKEYKLIVQSSWIGVPIIPNPLPPSVIAFATAMFGIGFIARRRRKKNIQV